ncbi:MAG TPA: Re/Si-specific NAD(P)(+) transhydrogenase subunit alpha [Anaeromyxobacter sp.]
MRIAVPKETAPRERRVGLVPENVGKLVKQGHELRVEKGAGEEAGFSDAAYESAGAKVVPGASALEGAELVARVRGPDEREAVALPAGAVVVGLLAPSAANGVLARLAERGVHALAMERVPRTTRAQSMDVLSSQATLAGFKAVILGAAALPRILPMMTTAAGTLAPAKAFVIGAGVAGLQAIATARRLGAQVWGYDVRPVVKEQVESLGAKFLEFDLGVSDAEDKGGYAKALSAEVSRRQQEMLGEKTKEYDVVVTTALVPGRTAPRLVTKETVAGMRPGSVIVDLAAEAGGNCELTEPDQVVVRHGVTIHGPTNLPATVPVHASQLYARNVTELLRELVKDRALALNFDDEIVKGACVTHGGEVVNDAVKAALAPRKSA